MPAKIPSPRRSNLFMQFKKLKNVTILQASKAFSKQKLSIAWTQKLKRLTTGFKFLRWEFSIDHRELIMHRKADTTRVTKERKRNTREK